MARFGSKTMSFARKDHQFRGHIEMPQSAEELLAFSSGTRWSLSPCSSSVGVLTSLAYRNGEEFQ